MRRLTAKPDRTGLSKRAVFFDHLQVALAETGYWIPDVRSPG